MLNAAAPAPQGWGKDSLSQYYDNARGNQFATFDRKRPAVADLIRVDGLFTRFLDGAINPRPAIPMNFMLRAHSAYRAATGATMAGQLNEAQALLRLCLEHGAYGFYIGGDIDRWKRWMGRHDSAQAKRAVKSEFTHGNIKTHIRTASKPLGDQFETLYERLIDFGAHPNEQGHSMSTKIRKADGDVHFETIYLHDDGLPLDLALKTTCQTGLWVLHVAQLIYAAKFELLLIKGELTELRGRY